MSPRPGRLCAVTLTPRLRGLVLETADHPATTAKLFTPLGLNVAVLDDAVAELRLDSGGVIQFCQGRTPTRIGLSFGVADLCGAPGRWTSSGRRGRCRRPTRFASNAVTSPST